ncbi:MAG TPA: 4Fe-4S ferredoxin, partial [Phycisphaerales bacterium]|nr:4Fe-4S ferredoxin [Phycisphaerales bacterium]
KGCICPIGSIQNIVFSIFDPGYAVPIVVVAFFLLPLIFTLFFGRTFCAAVCPLGAIQDIVLVWPVSVPGWLESALRLLAYIYLAVAVLLAATGSAFVICRYDPFVSIFRLSGSLNILILGGCLLLIGVFVGRPYCRFLCPYGVILRQMSRLSKWRVTITPDECIQCRLCEDSCPFGAIRKPSAQWPAQEYHVAKERLAFLLLLLPVLVFLGGWAGSGLKGVTSRANETVRLARQIYMEEAGKTEEITEASTAFRATGQEIKELYEQASNIRARFKLGGWILGGFIGLVIGLKLIGLSVWRQRTDYEADRASCLACGRCYNYCPREHLRLKKAKEVADKC